MTEQEAEAWISRLTRIWGTPPEAWWQQPEENSWRFRTTLSGRSGRAMLRYYVTNGRPHPELEDETHYLELSCCEGEIRSHSTSFSDEMESELLPQFVAEWMPLFRRGCWLSGCDIEATAREKIEWMQGFTRQELEEWHLKFLVYPQFEQIIQRVAAACDVKSFEASSESSNGVTFTAQKGLLLVRLELTHEGELYSLRIGDGFIENTTSLYFDTPEDSEEKQWFCYPHPDYNEKMVRAFYRLGFDDEHVFTQLHYPLSNHEKLELRHSMPREFWPQKWLDEEASP